MKERLALSKLSPYIPGVLLPGKIKLASNENPLGPSPKALEAYTDSIKRLHQYPEASNARLKTALAMQNVVRLLRAESREVQSIVQVRTFVVNLTPELARTVSRALEVFFTETAHRPASTMVGVTGLAAPEVRVEIEVVFSTH
jgi:enamine deaminase RidA (YjgF/YER057c/UK114 family)